MALVTSPENRPLSVDGVYAANATRFFCIGCRSWMLFVGKAPSRTFPSAFSLPKRRVIRKKTFGFPVAKPTPKRNADFQALIIVQETEYALHVYADFY